MHDNAHVRTMRAQEWIFAAHVLNKFCLIVFSSGFCIVCAAFAIAVPKFNP